jgi:RimJ/RimL family protein N-acetyltransferase
MDVHPVILTGKFVRLEPLQEAHVPGLAVYGLDDEIWRWMRYGYIRTQADMLAWVRYQLGLQAKGLDLPFAVVALSINQVVGASRYLNISHQDRSVEIGGTWYGRSFHGTAINPESKYLLLRHAFEYLDCVRVHFKTDVRNLHSQRAIEKLGAIKEGILRNHMILPDGTIRSSVIYSILAREWAQVKERLEERLAKY